MPRRGRNGWRVPSAGTVSAVGPFWAALGPYRREARGLRDPRGQRETCGVSPTCVAVIRLSCSIGRSIQCLRNVAGKIAVLAERRESGGLEGDIKRALNAVEVDSLD